MSYWENLDANDPNIKRLITDGINANPALKGLFTWYDSFSLPDATTLAMIKALNSATRQEIQADKIDCWAGGNYVGTVGRCITDPEEALNKAFRDIGNLQDDDNVRKARIEAYIANRFYGEIKDQGGDEDAIQAIINRYKAEGFYDTNRFISIGGTDGSGTGGDYTDEDPEQTFEDYVQEVGQGVANTAQGLYDELKDKITDCVGSPLDCVKKIGTAILDAGGIPEECQDLGDGTTCGTAENPTPCWKDCVSFNLPGLPIPNIPLPPGVVDIGTYRDFENAVKTVGKTVGDLINGDTTVEEVLEDLGTWAKEEWENVFGGIDDTTVDDVLDWLRGILGPVAAGIIWADIEEEITNILTPVGPETKTCPDGSVVDIDEDCPPDTTDCGPRPTFDGTFSWQQEAYIWDQECGPTTCLNGDPKTDPDGTNCEENSPNGFCEDGVTPKDNPEGTNCEEYVTPLTPEEQECNEQGRVFDDLNNECKEECANTEFVVLADGNCGPPEVQDCANGATTESGCEECPDGQTTPEQHEGGDCRNALIDSDDPCSIEPDSGSFQYFSCLSEGWGNCPEGTEKEGQWVKDTENNCGSSEVQECANGATTESLCEECPEGQSFDENGICVESTQECANGATEESGCEECPEGFTFDFNGICVAVSGFTCDDYNRTTNEDGTCGPCKEGYETDTSLPNEPCVKIFDGCSAGFELVNGECTAIVCPEGQSYCIDTDGCVDIGTCPSDPPEEGGGSGGGGGGSGGSGMFAIEPTTVTADAQLLSRPEFPITDYLAGLFTNSTGGSA